MIALTTVFSVVTLTLAALGLLALLSYGVARARLEIGVGGAASTMIPPRVETRIR